MCPVCRTIQEKNFDRHLNTHYDVSTRDGRNQKRRAKEEATRRTVQGLRECDITLLPSLIQEALKNDHQVMHGFRQFLDDVGVISTTVHPLKKEPQTSEEVVQGETSKKRKAEEDLEVYIHIYI